MPKLDTAPARLPPPPPVELSHTPALLLTQVVCTFLPCALFPGAMPAGGALRMAGAALFLLVLAAFLPRSASADAVGCESSSLLRVHVNLCCSN